MAGTLPVAAALALVVAMGMAADNTTSLFSFTGLVDIEGRPVNLNRYSGNVTFVINVASF